MTKTGHSANALNMTVDK